LHEKLLDVLGQYLAIGGMPEAVSEWVTTKTSREVKKVHADLIYTYQQDFGKYAHRHQIKYLNHLFARAIDQMSKKFMYSRVGEYKKRELEPALELLETAGLLYPVVRSAGQGIPIGAQADLDDFKVIFLDVGVSQALLKLDITPWFIDPMTSFINKGELVEAFVGQEILAYSDPIAKGELFHWRRETRGSHAEVDYLVQIKDHVIPVEVKAGTSQIMKSMQLFLEGHPNSPYGIRFSSHNYCQMQTFCSYPLYAVVKPFMDVSENLHDALMSLMA
jgi:predicted AAA+ superfamily ATPase